MYPRKVIYLNSLIYLLIWSQSSGKCSIVYIVRLIQFTSIISAWKCYILVVTCVLVICLICMPLALGLRHIYQANPSCPCYNYYMYTKILNTSRMEWSINFSNCHYPQLYFLIIAHSSKSVVPDESQKAQLCRHRQVQATRRWRKDACQKQGISPDQHHRDCHYRWWRKAEWLTRLCSADGWVCLQI